MLVYFWLLWSARFAVLFFWTWLSIRILVLHGTIIYIEIHVLGLAPRCVSVKDASILPTTGGAPFPTTFSVCEYQEQSFGVSTSKYLYWSTIGNSCYPHFQSEDTGFTLSALHTTTVHVFTLAVTVHFLVYSGVSDIPTKYCTNIYPDTASFHYRDSFLMLRLLLFIWLVYSKKGIRDGYILVEVLQKYETYLEIFSFRITTLFTHSVLLFNLSQHLSSDPRLPHVFPQPIPPNSQHLSSDPRHPQIFPQAIPPNCVIARRSFWP